MVFDKQAILLKAFDLLEDESSSSRNNNLKIVWRIVETLRKVPRKVSEKAKAAVIYFLKRKILKCVFVEKFCEIA